ncbi:MAG: hypothetical protein LCH91_23300 [Bacteroidetes bacterium]|nr:hypothetical protein [Bacteroidota bacterium]
MLRIILVIILFLVIAGYFFVQWANKPENVAALLQQRAEEKKQAHLDSVQAIENIQREQQQKREAAKKDAEFQLKSDKEVTLVVHETFANQHMNVLMDTQSTGTKLKDNELKFSTLVYKKSSSTYLLALTKTDYENFIAELDLELAGDHLDLGLVFNYEAKLKKTMIGEFESWSGDQITTSLQTLRTYLKTTADYKKLITFKEGLTFKSITKQRLRIVKKGKHLTISVNDQVKIDNQSAEFLRAKGKIGLVASTTNSSDWNESVIGTVKSLKIWTWN